MFRPIRKKKNAISMEAAKNLLHHTRRGVLAVQGEEGYPYAIPVNYLYEEENAKLFFHSARVGYKADAINRCDKVCFTVVGNERVNDEGWAPFLQSVVIFGRCHAIENQEEAMALLRRFARKFYPEEAMVEEEIALAGKAVRMYEIEIEHLSGKEVQER